MMDPRRETPPRVVVHGGFHKTGTSSAQTFLLSNGDNVYPATALVMPGKLRKGAARLAVRYSRDGRAATLAAFKDSLRDTLGALDLGLKRNAIISDENLCGRMPGRDGHEGYGAAPVLMAAVAEVIREAIHPETDIRFLFTTRDPDSWLHSCWYHNLRKSRMELDFDAFTAIHGGSAQLTDTVATIRAAVAPLPVFEVALEDVCDNPEGPASAILQLLGHPSHLREKMAAAEIRNRAPDPELATALLALNRSDLDEAALLARKAALLGIGIDAVHDNA